MNYTPREWLNLKFLAGTSLSGMESSFIHVALSFLEGSLESPSAGRDLLTPMLGRRPKRKKSVFGEGSCPSHDKVCLSPLRVPTQVTPPGLS